MPLEPGWLSREFAAIKKDQATWPDWLRRAGGLPVASALSATDWVEVKAAAAAAALDIPLDEAFGLVLRSLRAGRYPELGEEQRAAAVAALEPLAARGISPFDVQAGDGFVQIRLDGEEVLYWDLAEWEEDPEVVLAIVNAVRLAYERPDEMYAFLAEKGLI